MSFSLKTPARVLLAATLSAFACSATSLSEDVGEVDAEGFDASGPDLSVGEDAEVSGPRVQIGTGQDHFITLAREDVIEFVMGPQSSGDPLGGFHTWGAVRGLELNPNGTMVSFEVLRRDGMQVLGASAPRRVTLLDDGKGGFEAFGFPTLLDDCCALRNRPLLFRVHVVDGNQRILADEREVVGDAICPRPLGDDVCL